MIPDWLVSDFFSWLWWLSEEGRVSEVDGRTVTVVVDSSISFKKGLGSDRAAYRGQISSDARKSFGMGKRVDAMTLLVRVNEDISFEFRFSKSSLRAYKVTLPMSGESADRDAAVIENLWLLEQAEVLLEGLFVEFLRLRVEESGELLAKISMLGLETHPGSS